MVITEREKKSAENRKISDRTYGYFLAITTNKEI